MNPCLIKKLIIFFLRALFITVLSNSGHAAGVDAAADSEIATFLNWLHPEIVYTSIFEIAKIVATSITPVLLGLAILVRTMETQLDTLIHQGKWASAIKDMFLWGTVLGLYFAIFGILAAFANPIYAWLEHYGSVKNIADKFAVLTTALRDKQHNDSFSDMLIGGSVGVGQLFSFGFYYFTLMLLACVDAAAKLGYAALFGLAFVWGLVAIPLAITSSLKLLRGWGITVGVVFVWPLVMLLLGGMFTIVFSSAADHVVNDATVGATITVMQVHSLFGVSHLLLASIMIAAPFIANALVSNTSAVGSVVTPFFAAAAAAGAALFQTHKPIPMPRVPLIQGGGSSSPLQRGPRPSSAPPAARSGSVGQVVGGGGPRSTVVAPIPAAPSAAALGGAKTPTPPPASPAPNAIPVNAAPATQQQKRQRNQARRGAIVNQIKNRNPP